MLPPNLFRWTKPSGHLNDFLTGFRILLRFRGDIRIGIFGPAVSLLPIDNMESYRSWHNTALLLRCHKKLRGVSMIFLFTEKNCWEISSKPISLFISRVQLSFNHEKKQCWKFRKTAKSKENLKNCVNHVWLCGVNDTAGFLHMQISPQNRNHIQKYFSIWIRGPEG